MGEKANKFYSNLVRRGIIKPKPKNKQNVARCVNCGKTLSKHELYYGCFDCAKKKKE